MLTNDWKRVWERIEFFVTLFEVGPEGEQRWGAEGFCIFVPRCKFCPRRLIDLVEVERENVDLKRAVQIDLVVSAECEDREKVAISK